MSNKRKGQRRERQCRELYHRAGYAVLTFHGTRWGNKDGFNLFDLLAVAPERRPRFIQVKANTARGIEAWCDAVRDQMPREYVVCDFVVCHDREGWRLLQATESTHETVVDGRGDGTMGETLVSHLSDGR